MAVFRVGGGPGGQVDVRAAAQFAFVHVDITVAPAAQQAELDAAAFAVEAHVDLRAALFVVDLLGRDHEAVERVVRIVHPVVAAERVGRQAAALVQGAGHVVGIQFEARFHLVVDALFGTGVTDLVIDHRVGQLVLATQAGSKGVFLLGAVAHALLDRIRRQVVQAELVGASGDHVCVVEVVDHALARFGIVELAVQGAQVVLAVLVRAPVHVEVGTDALALDLVLAVLQVDRGDIARSGILLTVVLDFGVVRLELAVLVVHAQRHAEGIGEHFAVVERGLRAGLAGQLLVAGFDLATQAAAVAVEGRGRFNQHGAADGITGHVRGGRLDHAQAFGRIGGNDVQRCSTAGIFRGTHGDAIDADAVEVGIQAADDHETAFALVAGHADARQALQRFGDVLVRVLAQGIGRHGVFDGVAAALEVDRADLRFELGAHFDAVQVDGIGGNRAGGGQGLLPGGLQRCCGPQRQGHGDGHGQRSLDVHGGVPYL